MVVHMNPLTLDAELFYRPNDAIDNGDVSENVLNLFELAGEENGYPVSDDQVEGCVQEIQAESEEEMLVYACWIAECLTLRKEVDL